MRRISLRFTIFISFRKKNRARLGLKSKSEYWPIMVRVERTE
jgi:hypothetical protein